MNSIGAAIRRVVSRVASFWEERMAQARGQTYEAARAEMGGAPWREVPKSTDAWYILDEQAVPMLPPAEPGRWRVVVLGLGVAASLALLFFVGRPRPQPQPEALPSVAAVLAPVPTATPRPATPVEPGAALGSATPAVAHARHGARPKAAHHAATKSSSPTPARREGPGAK